MKSITIVLSQVFVALAIFSCGNASNETNEEQNDNDTVVQSDPIEHLQTVVEVIPVEYDNARLKVCIDSIWNCEKVANKNGEWRESSEGEMGLSMMQIDGEEKIYLDFGENNETRFINYWTFTVEPQNNYRITFHDVLKDENVDFAAWCQEE
jgi:hypothetical protein